MKCLIPHKICPCVVTLAFCLSTHGYCSNILLLTIYFKLEIPSAFFCLTGFCSSHRKKLVVLVCDWLEHLNIFLNICTLWKKVLVWYIIAYCQEESPTNTICYCRINLQKSNSFSRININTGRYFCRLQMSVHMYLKCSIENCELKHVK